MEGENTGRRFELAYIKIFSQNRMNGLLRLYQVKFKSSAGRHSANCTFHSIVGYDYAY